MEGFRELASGVAEPLVDLAEATGFLGDVEQVPSFDMRSDEQLSDVARSDESAAERERALWELGYRLGPAAIDRLGEAYETEPEPSVRANLLWLAHKVCRASAFALLDAAVEDRHPEVRDWAKLYLRETTGAELTPEYEEGVYTTAGAFDQTLPLQIAGFALVTIPAMGTLRVTLSPLWFESILGRVLACTNRETFMTDLTIEKDLRAFHEDGSDHYEIFPFSGVSWASPDGRIQHRYESFSRRAFYPSGRVHDASRGKLEIPVILNRGASSSAGNLRVAPLERTLTATDFFRASSPGQPEITNIRDLDARGIRLLNGKVVRDVRGQFFGWAFTSIEHYLRHGAVLPGTVQLANPQHAETARYVNTYLCGTFRGKAGDYDGDGRIDINLIPCHGTPDGQLDNDADGTRKPDPYE